MAAGVYRQNHAWPESPGETGVDRAIEILQSLVKQHPEVPQYRFDLSETYAMIEGPAKHSEGPAPCPQQAAPEPYCRLARFLSDFIEQLACFKKQCRV